MFSKTCEYAIRAMIYIAQKAQNGERTGIKEIAAEINSPEHFVAKILQDLVRKGLLQSVKGPNGGFWLNEASQATPISEIVRAIDGGKIFDGCGLGLKNCSESKPCPIHSEFKAIRQGLKTMLENTRIGSLSEHLEKHLTFLKN